MNIELSKNLKQVIFDFYTIMVCNGVCKNYKATKPVNMGRYEDGQKRCQTCQIFVYYNGLYCPCCNMRLRTSSRYTKLKEKAIPLIRL